MANTGEIGKSNFPLSFILYMALTLGLASCGGGGSAPPTQTATPTPPPPITDSCPVSTLEKTSVTKSVRPGAAGSVMVFSATSGWRHDSIPAGKNLLQSLAAQNGWEIHLTENAADFNESTLANYDVVVWLNTTGDVLSNPQQTAFENYIENGGGFVGIHSAADTEYDWPWYGELVGAYFVSHPEVQSAGLEVEHTSHPSTVHLAHAQWQHTDEWYNFQTNPRDDVTVLLSLDENSYNPGSNPMGDHPIAWYHTIGLGRAFYTGLGHTAAAFSNNNFIRHIEGALLWAGSMDKNVESWTGSPPPDSDFTSTALADGINEPMELEISRAGQIYVIGRRGEFYAMESRMLNLKSTISTNSANEGGLIGFVLDPEFTSNRRVYFHYTSPTVAEHIVSQININPDNTLEFASEQILLRYDVDMNCCHAAGDMDFDSEGNLFIATGDNTDPFESNGYTPIDERAGRRIYDAQRTSANTDDLRGKILRIKPDGDGSYSVPEGNLFTPDSLHRAEIYTMGHRNPFRIHVDKVTDKLYWGDIGPDAGGTNGSRGPRGLDEINRTAAPGNFGWPYFAGANLAYNHYNFFTETSGAKFNPQAVVNQSPNNTGATVLPDAIESWISMSHRALMVGDVYHWSSVINDKYKIPSYFHNRLLFWNFNNDVMYEVDVRDDQPTPRQWLNTSLLAGIIDAEISPLNNRLYLLGYGGNCCAMPANAGTLVEVQYRGDGPSNQRDISETFGVGDTVNLAIGGKVLSATSDGTLTFVDAGISNNEIFEFVDAGDDAVALRSVNSGLYVTAGNGGEDPLNANADTIGVEQQFEYKQNANGSASLRAYVNCQYVSLTGTGEQNLLADSSSAGNLQLFDLAFAQTCSSDASYGVACRTNSPAYLNMPDTPDASFSNVPALLSQTGAFANAAALTPRDGLIPYDVISPLWSDRAKKQRWVSIPLGERVSWSEQEKWKWPAGTVFVKHFALPVNESDSTMLRRLETRLVVVQKDGGVYGVTYKWRADNSDADLLTASLNEDITINGESGDWVQTWTYPGPEDCLTCHNVEAKYILGVKTAALNKNWPYPSGVSDNQLRTLINLGIFDTAIAEDAIADFPAHAALDDTSQSLETRVRSYWDINCANCHGPRGIASHWDARFDTPLILQSIVYGPLANQRDYFADYGLENPYVIDPASKDNSILYIRGKSIDDDDRMPPLGRQLEHAEYTEVLEQWIESLL